MNTDKENYSYHYMENVWFKKACPSEKGQLDWINLCIRLEDNTFVAVGVVYFYEGIYYSWNMERIGRIDDIALLNYVGKLTGLKPTKTLAPTNKSDISAEDVCLEYKRTNSIKGTARKVGISEEKTKKILISAGLYTSEKYRKINKLIAQGRSLEEISKELQISKKQLSVFVPSEKSNQKSDEIG